MLLVYCAVCLGWEDDLPVTVKSMSSQPEWLPNLEEDGRTIASSKRRRGGNDTMDGRLQARLRRTRLAARARRNAIGALIQVLENSIAGPKLLTTFRELCEASR